MLSEACIIHSATVCSIASSEIRNLPELHGATHTTLEIPSFHLPYWSHVLAVHEVPQIEQVMLTEVKELNDINSRLSTPQKSLDGDTLFHIHQTPLRRESQPYWHLIITAISCAPAILIILYFSLRPKVHHFFTHCFATRNSSETNPAPQTSSSLTTVPERPETAKEKDQYQENVNLTAYPMRHTH